MKELKELETALIEALKAVRKQLQTEAQELSSPKGQRSVQKATPGLTPSINDPDWPICIEPTKIVRSDAGEVDKRLRAIQIVGLLDIEYADQKVLDFGCGEGHISAELALTANHVTGYDIKSCDGWAEKRTKKLILTDDFSQICEKQYDVIILYDVLDHIEGNPEEIIEDLAGLLANNGIIQCRCHPWTSRHGGHLYEQKNLAYLHLMFSSKELMEYGLKLEPVLRITRPMGTYEGWFKAAGLMIEHKKITTDPPPRFIAQYIDRIISINWPDEIQPAIALKILANQFIDYRLRKM